MPPPARRADLLLAIRDCLAALSAVLGDTDLPTPLRLRCWHLVNRLYALLGE